MKKLIKDDNVDFGAWIAATVACVGADKTKKIKEEYELLLEFNKELSEQELNKKKGHILLLREVVQV
jgi:hypothetical protein